MHLHRHTLNQAHTHTQTQSHTLLTTTGTTVNGSISDLTESAVLVGQSNLVEQVGLCDGLTTCQVLASPNFVLLLIMMLSFILGTV